jgi:hypothetical protein
VRQGISPTVALVNRAKAEHLTQGRSRRVVEELVAGDGDRAGEEHVALTLNGEVFVRHQGSEAVYALEPRTGLLVATADGREELCTGA